MSLSRATVPAALMIFATACASSTTRAPDGPDPAPGAPPPVRTPYRISAENLRVRLQAYAHDSMMGREAGKRGNFMATAYLADAAQRLGLAPAGDGGTFFQNVPLMVRDVEVSVVAGGRALELGSDVVPLPPIQNLPVASSGNIDGVEVIYGGRMGGPDEIDAVDASGKLVVLAASVDPAGQPGFGIVGSSLVKFSGAAGLAIANLEYAPSALVEFLAEPSAFLQGTAAPSQGPLTAFVTGEAAELLMGRSLAGLAPGTPGPAVQGSFGFVERAPEAPARNVVAVLEGADPVLRGEYVAIGSHSDHVGITSNVVDHDSLRAYLAVVRPKGADDEERPATPQEGVRIRSILDSLRAERPRGRRDSISNGADDDGSGSVTMLEIARAMSTARPRPRRSILFVWHTAEELGLFGAQHFTEHSTVPRDAIVAQLNMDMIGRGGAHDQAMGGPGYIQLIGSRRLSTELGDLVEAVNTEDGFGFDFDYQYDADGHPQNFYCRSDHYMYARFGIPVVFFSTGGHRDYHQVTDEAQYIDYQKMARVGQFIQAVAARVANLDHRVVVDKPRPNPNAPCQQE